MKKIIGVLGVTLIAAVTFFNLSLIVNTNENADLASLIQIASANGEGGSTDCDYSDIWEDTWETTHTYKDHNGRLCEETWSGYEVNCNGFGSLCCTPEYVVTDTETNCGGPAIN